MRFGRRAYLAAVAGGLAGCAESPSDPDSDPGGTTAATDPSNTTTVAHDPSGDDFPHDLAASHDIESWPEYDPEWASPTSSPLAEPVEAEVLVENLEIPWDLAFAPTGELFITERTGRVLRFESGDVSPVAEPEDAIDAGSVEPGHGETEWWVQGGEGGTLGVAVHPSYPDPPVIYVYYTYEADGRRFNRVEAFDVSADDPNDASRTIVEGIPGETIHNGGRLTFGPENYLWVTTGDANASEDAQDPASLGGKVLRMRPDGSPAPGNPDLGGDADPRVFTYGHRNPQGLVWLPDGTPVATEHGPGGHDEVNVLRPGGNYGWPNARKPDEYADGDYEVPVVNTRDATWAPTGSVFYTGDEVPAWRNRMILGTLISQHVNVLTLSQPDRDRPPADDGERFDADWLDDSYTATSHRTFEDELGRVRHVEQGPDGGLYAVTSNRDGRAKEGFPREIDDVLVRLRPA